MQQHQKVESDEKLVTIALMVPLSLHRRLKVYCVERETSQRKVITDLLRGFVAKLPPLDDDTLMPET